MAGSVPTPSERRDPSVERLLSPALEELGLPHEYTGAGAASVRCGDCRFQVIQRIERHFLMRIEVAEFRIPLRLRGGPGRIRLRHRARQGPRRFTAAAKPATAELTGLAARLAADDELNRTFGRLDAKRAVLEIGPQASTAVIRNVGLSRVVMALPPTRKYIAAGDEQIRILRATISRLADFA